MFASLRADRLAHIDRLIDDLERRATRLSRVASRASWDAPDTAHRIADSIAPVFGALAERFRGRTKAVGREAAEFGDDLLKFGNDAVRKLASDANRKPVVMLTVAFGVGMLAAGLLARRS